jgi:hypothetical protein
MSSVESIEKRAAQFAERYKAVQTQLGRVIVGHDEIVHGVLTCLFVGGHCLLEGVPGLGKTLLVRTLSQTLSLDFSRIQFTPDLMPADILGTNMIVEDQTGKREFQFQKGLAKLPSPFWLRTRRHVCRTRASRTANCRRGDSHRACRRPFRRPQTNPATSIPAFRRLPVRHPSCSGRSGQLP